MFLSKEQREKRRQLNDQIKGLETHHKNLKGRLTQRRKEAAGAIEAYTQAVSEKWEYLEVSSRNVSQWGSLNDLGSMGWELVGIANYAEGGEYKSIYTLYVFKRRAVEISDALAAVFADVPAIAREMSEAEDEIRQLKQGS